MSPRDGCKRRMKLDLRLDSLRFSALGVLSTVPCPGIAQRKQHRLHAPPFLMGVFYSQAAAAPLVNWALA
jgi:hypothetical protein